MAFDYYATFRETLEMTRDQVYELMACNDANPYTLQEIIEICQAVPCDADLYDEAGFPKGWVHADGSYRLQ